MLQLARIVPRSGLGALLLSLPLLVAGVAAAPAARRPPVSRSTPSLSEAAHGLLVKRCFQCHAAGKASGLDLRTQEGALRGGSRGPALLPGNPAASPLYRSVTEHGAPRMPPAGPLPAAEQELLRQWIAAGASWPAAALESPGGWAFRRLTRPPTPHVRRKEWARNPIDAFILAKLEAKGLSPAPPADRRTLIRRLYFDLIGLPPTPEAIDAFLKDRAPDAYGQLVERLLQSPRYGERWARHWLDVARFSESQGFERDKIRDHAWRYRDYVIRAFNADMPYDRFVREQIAGDVLPGATRDSLIATGFLVAGPWDEVGVTQSSAVMRARVREDELEDMVGVVGQSFLGLTVHCARCHDHKFDPIPQRDYYRLQAALADVRPGDRALPAAPDAARRQADVERLSAQVRTLEGQIAAVDAAGRARAASRARVAGRAPVEVGAGAVSGAVRAPQPIARWSFEGDGRDTIGGLPLALTGGATLSNGRLRLDGRDGSARSGPLPWSLSSRTLEAWVDLGALDQRGGGVMTIEDEVGRVFDAITYGERQPRRWAAGSNGFLRTIDLRGGDEATPAGTLVHVAVTYGADDRITVYRNGQRYADSYLPGRNPESTLRTYSSGGSRVLFGLRHSAGAQPGDGRWLQGEIEEARLYDRALTAAEIEASFRGGPPVVSEAAARAALTPEEAATRARSVSELARVRAELETLTEKALTYGVTSTPAPAVHVLDRGDVLKKGELVTAAGLSCLPGLGAELGLAPDAPSGAQRAKLAEWITRQDNPLTPRVMANRIWQYHFGRGIAGSPSDFGVNGEPPTHPELLDWLASYFISADRKTEGRAWSVKKLHRLIVTSNTYRQSGQLHPRAAALDAENRLLWRMSPRRLEAEELRDAVLAVSGQLNLREGGPGFRPFSLVISNSYFYTYEDKVGPEFNRRSIYRTVVNSGGVPLLEAFDCPDPSVKTPRRGATTTPLQALMLLNNSFILREAKELARGLKEAAGPDPARQVATAYRRAFGRSPTPAEARRAEAFVKEHGLAPFCRVLFNASEFLYVP